MATDPITTATAKILIEPDTSKFDDFKEKAEQDIAELGEKFKAALTVNLDELSAQMQKQIDALKPASETQDESQEIRPQGERIQTVPDQLLVKITELQQDVSAIAKALEELVEAMTTNQ